MGADNGDFYRSIPQQRVYVDQDRENTPVVPDKQAASKISSVFPESPKEIPKKIPWWRRWFKKKTKKQTKTPLQNNAADDTRQQSSAAETSKETTEDHEGKEDEVGAATSTSDPIYSFEYEDEDDVQEDPSTSDPIYSFEYEDDEDDVQEDSSTLETINDCEGEEDGLQVVFPKSPPSSETDSDSDSGGGSVLEIPFSSETILNDELDSGCKISSPSPSSTSEADEDFDDDEKRSLSSSETSKDFKVEVIQVQETPSTQDTTAEDENQTFENMKDEGFFSFLKRAVESPPKKFPCLGFPNLGVTCYMNSALQGLLSLKAFTQEIYSQQPVWSSNPDARIIKAFVDADQSRSSNNEDIKYKILNSFRLIVAKYNPEFMEDSQQDAHEFLSSVLSEMSSLSDILQTTARRVGLSYTCPVEAHITFQMLSTRTCTKCASQSMTRQDFTNLSLDLVKEGSINQCLELWLQETTNEFKCECGAQASTQKWSFLTLPNVLILQLQRFKYTSFYELKKLKTPITISPELEVNAEACALTETSTRYSLVSVISHLGCYADCGHYICEGSYSLKDEDTDCWMKYNDDEVVKTSREAVCKKRKQSAYLLFYEKKVSTEIQVCANLITDAPHKQLQSRKDFSLT